MGLDQYLFKRTTEKTDKEQIYWRKANFVHWYFTHDWEERGFESDDVTEFPVTQEDLHKLVGLCTEVLENHSKARSLLPTMGGFFFGSTDYDDWYFEGVQFTKDEVSRLLEDARDDDEFYYYAWY